MSEIIDRKINKSSCLQNSLRIEPLPSGEKIPFLIFENISAIFITERMPRGIIEHETVITHSWIKVSSDKISPHIIVNGNIA